MSRLKADGAWTRRQMFSWLKFLWKQIVISLYWVPLRAWTSPSTASSDWAVILSHGLSAHATLSFTILPAGCSQGVQARVWALCYVNITLEQMRLNCLPVCPSCSSLWSEVILWHTWRFHTKKNEMLNDQKNAQGICWKEYLSRAVYSWMTGHPYTSYQN